MIAHKPGSHCSLTDENRESAKTCYPTARPLTIFLKPANISEFVVKGIYVTYRSDLREFSFGIPSFEKKTKKKQKKIDPSKLNREEILMITKRHDISGEMRKL